MVKTNTVENDLKKKIYIYIYIPADPLKSTPGQNQGPNSMSAGGLI